jgi:hypothetical protein
MFLEVTRLSDSEKLVINKISIVYCEEITGGTCLYLTPSYGYLQDNFRKFDHEKLAVSESYADIKSVLLDETVVLQI